MFTLKIVFLNCNAKLYISECVQRSSSTSSRVPANCILLLFLSYAKWIVSMSTYPTSCWTNGLLWHCSASPFSAIHELPSALPLSSVLQKPGLDLADTYVTFVRQNQGIIRDCVSDQLYIKMVFDVSASAVSSLHVIMSICVNSSIVAYNLLCWCVSVCATPKRAC